MIHRISTQTVVGILQSCWQEDERKEEGKNTELGAFVDYSFLFSVENGSGLIWPFVTDISMPASLLGAVAALCQRCGCESFLGNMPWLPSSCVCGITELGSAGLLNGVFVTTSKRFKMLRGPHY